MKIKIATLKKISGVALTVLFCAAVDLHAQVRGGGGGGGFGGGGFRPFGGGGGFGGGGFNNSSANNNGYNNNGTVGSATFSIDPDTHTITYIADEQTSTQISNVLASLDRPKPQVLIKVVFLEVQHNGSLDIGVEGGWTGKAGSQQVSAANIFGLSGLNSVATNFTAMGQALPNGFPTPLTAAGAGGLYQVLGSDFQATLRAIEQSGKAEILSRPSILARDGQPATILVGQEVPLVTGISYQTVGANTVPINNVTYTPVGIQLNVTPYISDNLVEMIVTPQDSAVDPNQTEPIGGGVNAPVIDTRSADTVVVTPDAQTVVIGGLMENDKAASSSKIPLLGDIPILGALFRSKTTADTKDELLIFMTPHIVHAPSQLAYVPNEPAASGGFITNSVSEEELDQYLDHVPVKKP